MAKPKKTKKWPTKTRVATLRLYVEDIERCKAIAEERDIKWNLVARQMLHEGLNAKKVIE